MKTEIIPASDIHHAIKILRNGGIVAFPTDTVYGLGALAFNNSAVESIYTAKDRPIEKAIPVLIADVEDMEKVADADRIPRMARIFASRFWPGPLTCIVPKNERLPAAISATDTVAIRIPDHSDTRSLLRASGALAVTSANISGAQSPTTAQEVFEQLNGRIPLILDGGKTPGGIPSTLVDCTGKSPEILRDGPIKLAELQAVL
jgi:L-threonylcarbamoyladenylate synthase